MPSDRPDGILKHFMWLFQSVVLCDACGGDGYAKPPGWPDPEEIERLKPKLPPPPSPSY